MGLCVLSFNKSFFIDQLEAAGHKVIVAGVNEEQSPTRLDLWSQKRLDFTYTTGEELRSILNRLPSDFSPDRIVYHDDSYAALRVTGWEGVQIPSLFYSVDAHIHGNWHSIIGGVFDAVLVAQKDYVPLYEQYAQKALWFPLWAPKVLEPSPEKSIDVCFRGNLNPTQRPERVAFLQHIAREVSLDYASGSYEDVFARSKIILNEAIHDDVNFRVFESLACGGMLLTPRTGNGLSDMFLDGEEIVIYEKHNVQDAVEKCRYYLAHDEARERIAHRGREKIISQHSEHQRGEHFRSLVEKLEKGSCPTQYYSSAYQLLFSRKQYPSVAVSMPQIAKLLMESVQRKERYDQTLVLMLLRCIDNLEDKHLAATLAMNAMKAYAQETILVLLAIFALRKAGRETDAVGLARILGRDSSEVLILVDSAIKNLSELSGDI